MESNRHRNYEASHFGQSLLHFLPHRSSTLSSDTLDLWYYSLYILICMSLDRTRERKHSEPNDSKHSSALT
jgi:hypothetical protein